VIDAIYHGWISAADFLAVSLIVKAENRAKDAMILRQHCEVLAATSRYLTAGLRLGTGPKNAYLCHYHERQVVRMATGWAPDGAVQEQIDDSITDEVMRARARMPAGEGSTHCVECGEEIPPARRRAMPGVRTCVPCQSAHDRLAVNSGINRRANKDSQLR